jgi:hypothetical protein
LNYSFICTRRSGFDPISYALSALLIVLAVGLAACGPTLQPPRISSQLLQQEASLQRELLLKAAVDRQARLQRIYTPLRISNADLCGTNVSSVTGLIGIDRQSIPVDQRAVAHSLYGIADGVTIIDVVPDSPSAQIGLQPRDVITGAANGAGVMPSGWTTSGLTTLDLVKVIASSNGKPITMLIRRMGNVFPLLLTPRLGCSYPIEAVFNDTFNAFADGNRIAVYTCF